MTVRDMIFLTNLQIKRNQKNFSGLTDEEERMYSDVMKKIDNQNDNI